MKSLGFFSIQKLYPILISLLLLMACGGGGGGAPAESPAPPSDHAEMVVMFGTSLTAGEDAQGLAYMLGAHEKELNIWIRNRGWGGHSSLMLLDHLQEARDLKGDVVLIECVMNDAGDPELLPELALPLEESRLYTTMIVKAFLADGARVYLMTTNPELHEPSRHPNLAAYYQMVREVAWDTGCGLIDMYPEWLKYSTGELHEMIPDHVHPLNTALDVVAWPKLKEVLK